MWPGLVGKGSPGAEPAIDLDTMLNLTAAARVNGTRFDGVDLFLFDPHVSIDSSDDDLKKLALRPAASQAPPRTMRICPKASCCFETANGCSQRQRLCS
jgi:hypothetical protein